MQDHLSLTLTVTRDDIERGCQAGQFRPTNCPFARAEARAFAALGFDGQAFVTHAESGYYLDVRFKTHWAWHHPLAVLHWIERFDLGLKVAPLTVEARFERRGLTAT